MEKYRQSRKIDIDGTMSDFCMLAKYDWNGDEIAATYATKEDLVNYVDTSSDQTISGAKTFLSSPRFNTGCSAGIGGVSLSSVMGGTVNLSPLENITGEWALKLPAKNDTIATLSDISSGGADVVTLDDSQTITGEKNFTGGLKKNGVDVATTSLATSTASGLMSSTMYKMLNTPANYLKYYNLNGAYHYIGGQGTATHSSGKYHHIGRYITSGTIRGTAEVSFTNCSGKITVTGSNSKVYIENSPNLTVTQQTSGNVFIDGKALIYDKSSLYTAINKGYPNGVKVGGEPSFTNFGYKYYIVQAVLSDHCEGTLPPGENGSIFSLSGSGNYFGLMCIQLTYNVIKPIVSREWEIIGTGSNKTINVFDKNSVYYISKLYGVKQ